MEYHFSANFGTSFNYHGAMYVDSKKEPISELRKLFVEKCKSWNLNSKLVQSLEIYRQENGIEVLIKKFEL